MFIDVNAAVEEYAERFRSSQQKSSAGMTSGPEVSTAEAKGKVQEVIDKLRALNIPWFQIAKALATILPLVFSGAPVPQILAAVLALLGWKD